MLLKKIVAALCAIMGFCLFAADTQSSVTVKATPIKGQVFAGWYTDASRTNPYSSELGGVDYRNAQMTYSMPEVLALTTFSNLVEIFNRVKSVQERLFYIVYAHRERLKTLELRKYIVDDTYSSLLGGGKKNFSNALKVAYPDSPVMFKDQAFVDFLNLPAKHTEKRLRKGIVKNMKDFILSIGLEALDRDVRRQNENPSIGILLCKNADSSVVEYAMLRTMSPAMVAEYKRMMIPKEVLRESFEAYLALPSTSNAKRLVK